MKSLPICSFRSNFLFIFIFIAGNSWSQLSGIALLSGQSNHSGIKVKFIANSGTAVTDSCLTDASGNFSINISGGTYKVTFKHAGYSTFYYNNTNPVVLTNTTVLPPVTIVQGYSVTVSGTASGVWADSVEYLITGNLTIPLNTTLTIQPGTKVRFMGHYDMYVNGQLNAVGSSTNRIIITGDSTNTWNFIDLNNDNSVLDYCTIEFGFRGITTTKSPTITNCMFRKMGRSVILSNAGSPLIQNNEVYYFNDVGITLVGSNGTVSCNHIHHGNYYGAIYSTAIEQSSGTPLILNNHIHHTSTGMGISAGTVAVRNNYVHDISFHGIVLGSPAWPGSNLEISNNTIVNIGWYGVSNTSGSVGTKIFNNIIVDAKTAGVLDASEDIYFENNLLYNCAVNFYGQVTAVGLGQIVNTNANGDPVDSYFNLFQDPLFISNQEPYLHSSSPVYGAGKSSISANIGANPQMICYENLTVGIENYILKQTMPDRLFPNPNKGVFTLELHHNSNITVYNSQGKMILTKDYNSGSQIIHLHHLEVGIYFVRVRQESGTKVLKMLVVQD